MTRIKHPEWRDFLAPTKYPFEDGATLVTEGGNILLEDVFLDAAFYPTSGASFPYLSKVTVTSTKVILYLGDEEEEERASGEFDINSPPDQVRFVDVNGFPAGVIVSESIRLSFFQSWDRGDHTFQPESTPFVVSVYMPTPEQGVRGIQLDDGSILTNDVYLVGDDGVMLSCRQVTGKGPCERDLEYYVIRVDVVGDPLWKRKECAPGLFETPRFIETVTFQQGKKQHVCGPGDFGDIKIMVGNQLAEDTILRIRPVESGLIVEAVGETLENIR